MNYTILIALMIQGAIAKSSRLAGAVAGILITVGIFVWGLSVYSDGGGIVLFSIPLSQGVFIGACVVWFLFDGLELSNALKTEEDQQPESTPQNVESSLEKRESLLGSNKEG